MASTRGRWMDKKDSKNVKNVLRMKTMTPWLILDPNRKKLWDAAASSDSSLYECGQNKPRPVSTIYQPLASIKPCKSGLGHLVRKVYITASPEINIQCYHVNILWRVGPTARVWRGKHYSGTANNKLPGNREYAARVIFVFGIASWNRSKPAGKSTDLAAITYYRPVGLVYCQNSGI